MAIFGSFDELTPAEALTVVGKATGTLFIRTGDLGAMELHVRSGRVVGLTVCGRSVADTLELQGVVTDLVRRREGIFEFRRRSLEGQLGTVPTFDVPLAQLVMNGLGFTEEIGAFQDTLPSPKTVFELHRAPTIWLGDQLQPFFERVEAALRDGASAEELAIITRVSTDEARWFLYKLRLAGVIKAHRCAAAPTLRKRLAPATTPEAETSSWSRDADLRHVQVARPARAFLARLLTGLTSLLRPSSTF